MIWNVNNIWSGLWQGARPPHGTFLAERGFQTLVLAAKEIQDAHNYQDIVVIKAPGDDDDRPHRLQAFLPVWHKAADVVAKRVADGQKVLVTCAQGLNRSGFITCVALHKLTGWDGGTCVDHIQHRREDALFNSTFVDWLSTNLKKPVT